MWANDKHPKFRPVNEKDVRFYPTRKTIYNIVMGCRLDQKKNESVAESMGRIIDDWCRDTNDSILFSTIDGGLDGEIQNESNEPELAIDSQIATGIEDLAQNGAQHGTQNPVENSKASNSNNDSESNPKVPMLVIQTTHMRKLMELYGRTVFLDSTFGTNYYGYSLFLVMVVDNSGQGQPVAVVVLGQESIASIKAALEVLKKWNPTWQPAYFMTDKSDRERGAIKLAFPNAKLLLCEFHRLKAIRDHLHNKARQNGLEESELNFFIQSMRELAKAMNEDHFLKLKQDLKDHEITKRRKWVWEYLVKNWFGKEEEHWCQHRRNQEFTGGHTTNNITESANRVFKLWLKNRRRFDDVLVCFLTEILPFYETKYLKNNADSDHAFRAQLVNPALTHPLGTEYYKVTIGIRNQLKNIQEAAIKLSKNAVIKKIGEKYIIPISDQHYKTLKYVYGSQIPQNEFNTTIHFRTMNCQCAYWKMHNWPCIHFFMVASKFGYKWSDVDEKVRSSQHFSIDEMVLKAHEQELKNRFFILRPNEVQSASKEPQNNKSIESSSGANEQVDSDNQVTSNIEENDDNDLQLIAENVNSQSFQLENSDSQNQQTTSNSSKIEVKFRAMLEEMQQLSHEGLHEEDYYIVEKVGELLLQMRRASSRRRGLNVETVEHLEPNSQKLKYQSSRAVKRLNDEESAHPGKQRKTSNTVQLPPELKKVQRRPFPAADKTITKYGKFMQGETHQAQPKLALQPLKHSNAGLPLPPHANISKASG